MRTKDYYLGLDMGVTSIGWAVTDEHYKILRAKGKDLWGIREFDEAETSASRRISRTSRRRRQRQVAKIGMLKTYFEEAVREVDPNFFIRLENSKYHKEDKADVLGGVNGIFNDLNYTDKDYYTQFPTIFHLRSELIHNEEPHDVRLVFLALLNMFKHRGHFLNAGMSVGEEGDELANIYSELLEKMEELNSESVNSINFTTNIEMDKITAVLGDRGINRTRKSEKLVELLCIDSMSKRTKQFVKLLSGLKVKGTDLFENLELEEDRKIEICFDDFSYEDKIPELMADLGDENYYIIELMKKIYDIGSLAGILKDFDYLSDSRVADYEKHAHDLKLLKNLYKKYKSIDEYNKMFREDAENTYSAYVKSVNSEGYVETDSSGKIRRGMKCKTEELYKVIKKDLESYKDDEQVVYILDEMEKGTFLPKQLTAANGVIPNQVHEKEMRKILANAEKYLPFLTEKDESNLTVSERILKLFTFQIPYYIGPLSENSKNGWVVRTVPGDNSAVLPWNIEEKVDMKETSAAFIDKMVRTCTYVSGERVLPKTSLAYQSYCVLNEINNIRIDGEKISVKLKQDIYNELFMKGKKVTRNSLCKYLIGRGILKEAEQLSGIDVNINNSLSSWGKFYDVFGEKLEEDKYKRIAENIIYWCTLYGDSKKFLVKQIEDNYGEEITPQQLKRIVGIKFKDWGNLSKEFLSLQGCDKSTGEVMSLIRALWETNNNMMELINSDEFTFNEALKEKQKNAFESITDIAAEDLDDMYFSAPVKRMVWQTILLIKEITQIMGKQPTRLFLEMTRNKEDKPKRKDSRKKQFLDLYKNIKDEEHNWKEIIENADSSGKLRSKKMYLYLTQMGRDMYTGKPIDLKQLFDDNLYDVDHIYPRHFVKDDNISNNLVLVNKPDNANKKDIVPLDASIRASQKAMWKGLLDKKLITEEKYKRLTRTNPFSEEEQAGFIARQLVETSQGTKGLSDLLRNLMPNTEFVYSKASNVSEFRKKYDRYKSRTVNDFHHAHDAYLNIVVGNVYLTKFTHNPRNFIKNEFMQDKDKHNYNLSRMFDWDVKRNGKVAWIVARKGGENGTIETVKAMLDKNTPLMTRMNFVEHGSIADATLYGKRKAKTEGYIPLKSSDEKMTDVTKYGGFSNVSIAYFFLVEHELKKKRVRTLETVPVYLTEKIELHPEMLETYCEEQLGLVNFSIRIRKIKMQSLINKDGYYVYLSGKTGDQISLRNAVNMCLGWTWNNYIKKIDNYSDTKKLDKAITAESNIRLYDELTLKHTNTVFNRKPNSLGKVLVKGRGVFEELSLEKQCETLNRIILLTNIGPTREDLTAIKGSKNCGVMTMIKNINGAKEVLLINQSITGVYEHRINLLTV